ITLPDPHYRSMVSILPTGSGEIEVEHGFSKVEKAIALTIKEAAVRLRRPDFLDIGCKVTVMDTGIPRCAGMGSSSSHCVGGVLATAGMLGWTITDVDVLTLVFEAEGPCDPLTSLRWGTTLLWASRQGFAFEVIERPLPALAAIG